MPYSNYSSSKILWTYLDISDPLVCWEVYRGILISPDCYKIEQNPSISFWQLKFLKNISSVRAMNELRLEIVRQKFYPDKISRFRGLYYFEDKETAIKAANLWNLKHFNEFCLTEVELFTDFVYSKHDSNWITYYLSKNNDNFDWIHSYWRGEICSLGEEPIWELLVVARGRVLNKDLRQSAYNLIKEKNPTTVLPFLEQSRLAAFLGSDLGHCSPCVFRVCENKFRVSDIIDMKDARNDLYIKKLHEFLKNPENSYLVNWNDLNLIDRYDVFSVPDTRERNFEFTLPKEIVLNFDINALAHK